jgi:hypothetical protein
MDWWSTALCIGVPAVIFGKLIAWVVNALDDIRDSLRKIEEHLRPK